MPSVPSFFIRKNGQVRKPGSRDAQPDDYLDQLAIGCISIRRTVRILANWYPKTSQFPSPHHGIQVRYGKPWANIEESLFTMETRKIGGHATSRSNPQTHRWDAQTQPKRRSVFD